MTRESDNVEGGDLPVPDNFTCDDCGEIADARSVFVEFKWV